MLMYFSVCVCKWEGKAIPNNKKCMFVFGGGGGGVSEPRKTWTNE